MKKITSLVLAMIIAVSTLAGLNITAFAVGGNSMNAAQNISLNTSYTGNITSSDNLDYYKFTLSTSGKVTIPVTQYIYKYSFYLYDADKNTMLSSTYNTKESQSAATDSRTFEADLLSGTYYLFFEGCSKETGKYTFSVKFTSANESFKESKTSNNDSKDLANAIEFATEYKGQMATNETYDYYKINLTESGELNISITQYLQRYTYRLYDSNKYQR